MAGLSLKMRLFCREYVILKNQGIAYMNIYKCKAITTAKSNAHKLLKRPDVKEYIKELESNLEDLTGVSKARNLIELAKIAYSNISLYHETWIKLNAFKNFTPEQLAAIESTETKTEYKTLDGSFVSVVYIKIKLHNKLTALDLINKMMGYNHNPKQEIEVTTARDFSKYTTDELNTILAIEAKAAKRNETGQS